MTSVEDARRRYSWEAFRLKNEAAWRTVSCRTRADDNWWHLIALDVDAASLAYDLAVSVRHQPTIDPVEAINRPRIVLSTVAW